MSSAARQPTAAGASHLVNVLTVDLEAYFHATAFAPHVARTAWESLPARLESACDRLLEMFDRHRVLATFFVLGWIGERFPGLVRRIAAAGHEIGCHGLDHRLIYDLQPKEFRAETRRARRTLEEVIGQPVIGYRAATFSITAASQWALDVLIEERFLYDSSIFPIHHDRYGLPGAPRFAHTVRRPAGLIVELPPSTVQLGSVVLALSGGGYFRLYPYWLFRRGVLQLNRVERQPLVFLIHPWEIDPGQPKLPAPRLTTWRHRVNLSRTLPRLERLLGEFTFAPAADVLRNAGWLES
jgi:polysaccharide deacetylase family protein (PEP-CTERM system associated)